MKQQNDLLSRSARAALLLPFMLTSCSDEMHVFRPDDGASGLRIELKADIDQTADTRADESGFADGDRFGLFVVNYSDGKPSGLTLSGNQVNNVAMTYSADANQWHSATDIYWRDPITPADVYGYYPFFNGMSNVDAYSFEVRADQSVKGEGEMSAYEASDFLWAKTPKAAPGKKVELSFGHMMAGVKVVLQQGSGFDGDAWTKLEKTVTVDNTVRTSEIDLSTGKVTPVGSYDRNVVMNPEGDAWRAVVVPQTVAAGKSNIGITIDGKAYTFTRPDGMTYTAGKLHLFTIKIDRKGDGGDYALTLVSEDITPWEADKTSHDFEASSYVVVHVAEPGTLKETLQSMGGDFSTIRNLKVTGTLTENDFWFLKDEMSQLTSLHIGEIKMVHCGMLVFEEGKDDRVEYHDDMLAENAFYGKKSLRRIVLPQSMKRVGPNALRELELTSTLVIPEGVTHIERDGCAYQWDQFAIVMPSTLEYIGSGAFAGVHAHMEYNLTNKVKYIGDRAFEGASGLTGTFSIPSKVEYLGESAFARSGMDVCGHDMTGDLIFPSTITEILCGAPNFANGTNLIIPEGVTKIGGAVFVGQRFNNHVKIPSSVKFIDGGAFQYADFRGGVTLPDGLVFVGDGAFAWSSFSGHLDFPKNQSVTGFGFQGSGIQSLTIGDNVNMISSGAFEGCGNLRTVTIGKNVEYIGENAFYGMDRLETVVCFAQTPPIMTGNEFSGFDLDRAILEVPEGKVEEYRATTGWNAFRNITEHHELAFNIPEIRCLDKGVIREGVIRSEGAWSVVECPEWVHVSPDHADFKDQVTVTVDRMPEGSDSREGRIVFKLDGKDYTAYTTVRQLSYEHAEDAEIILQEASSGHNEIPIFIVGEGFNADHIVNGEYMNRMHETMEQFFDIEPYRSLRDYFTVSTAVTCCPSDGTGDFYDVNFIGNCFDTEGVVPDAGKLKDYVSRVSSHAGANLGNALIIMVSKTNSFSGWSDIDWEGCAMAGIGIIDDAYPYDQRGLVQHFAGGAAFAGLGEENVSHFEHIKGCTCPGCSDLGKFNDMKNRGYFANLSMSSKMADAPWQEFIFHPNYSDRVDMWEGGHRHLRGVWRSEANSVMNTYISYFNTISRYTIYKEVMRKAGLTATIDDFIANDKIELPQ